jgi:hypothetical protein
VGKVQKRLPQQHLSEDCSDLITAAVNVCRRRVPALNPPVNKRLLSTGESGEFASESVGFDLNPGG